MKKIITACLMALFVVSASADVQVKEKLNRAPVAVKTSQGILVSWRYLGADGDATFSVYRNGSLIKESIADVTNYLDADGQPGDTYKVVSSKGGEAECEAWDNMFTKISIPRPAARKSLVGGLTGRYRPDDISVGDVDGDGDYELIVKWFPDNQRDSGKDGIASATYIDCYEMDGTQKWRIDVGDGVRSGNHTTQFLVYDFDGDGKAEVIFKTAPDSKDGQGNYVTQAGDATIKAIAPTTVVVNSKGRVTAGAEFLTVFNGETGAAMHTIFYSPGRSMVDFPNSDTSYSSSWGDSSYNRGERYNAAVAYLDGLDKLPTAIMERGYYSACYIWAVDWNGTALKTRWLHKGTAKEKWSLVDAAGTELANETTDPVTSQGKSSYGQGVHSISVGDVNNDGFDDICIGAATIGHDGKLLCATGFGHGDAIHLADLVPDRPGLEVMMPHEEKSSYGNFGYDVHDATTGEILASATGAADNGRGMACDFIPANRGSEFWSSDDNITRSCVDGTQVSEKKADTNFRIYWTGDPFDQTFDGRYDNTTSSATYGQCFPRIRSWNTSSNNILTFQEFADYGKPQTCNTTKATPCLQADLMGDWREELIMINYEADWSAPTCDLLIYSTPEPTKYKVPCLMEDHMYRMGIAWQNASYNQPPHLGYSLAEKLGIDRATYTTQTDNHAPEKVVPPAPSTGEEIVGAPSADKGTKVGTCYTVGMYEEFTDTQGKVRTGNNNNTITINVNEGYKITSMTLKGHSNNSSSLADRSIIMTNVAVDGTDINEASLKFPGGTAGTADVTRTINMEATQNIVLTFDNSNIVTKEEDPNGKNKQLIVTITLNYEKTTAVNGIAEVAAQASEVLKVLVNGKFVILKAGKEFNAAGQLVK
ncbi:MAG: FG-GAP repeat protein [Prevotella sp.]|nr:FG-GAP repeat protein [Prevotella sp.]